MLFSVDFIYLGLVIIGLEYKSIIRERALETI